MTVINNLPYMRHALAAFSAVFFLSCTPAETSDQQTSAQPQPTAETEQAQAAQSGEVVLLSPSEFEGIIRKNGTEITVLDVRTPGEMQGGCIEGALLSDLNDRALFESRAEALNPEQPVMVYCEIGGRSRVAADLLSKRGFTVYDLRGGMRAWRKTSQKIIFLDGNL